jgi:KipI family sensor histidine kinase inhibitor
MAACADSQLAEAAQAHGLPPDVRCIACSEYYLVVEFGRSLSLDVNAQAAAFAAHLRAAGHRCITDLVPALASVGVHYRPDLAPARDGELPHVAMRRLVAEAFATFKPTAAVSGDALVIPVCYGGEFGPDLEAVAQHCGLTPDEVVDLHTQTTAVVLMLCFAPGHSQLGLWDERLNIGRRSTPRMQLAAGSVAIANRQTVIYPFVVPGGWNVIGRTPLKMFDPDRENPCLLSPGMSVRFEPIAADRFDEWVSRS